MRHSTLRYQIILVLSFLTCFTLSAQSSYEIVLKTDFDGQVVEGSKSELIRLIREGKPVRIGWQLDFDEDKVADFDHWMEAEFITILDNEVFTQIRNINAQMPNIDAPQIEILSDNLMWTAVLGTNGKLVNRFVMEDLKIEKDSRGQPIITKEVEEAIAMRQPEVWKVATFWSVLK